MKEAIGTKGRSKNWALFFSDWVTGCLIVESKKWERAEFFSWVPSHVGNVRDWFSIEEEAGEADLVSIHSSVTHEATKTGCRSWVTAVQGGKSGDFIAPVKEDWWMVAKSYMAKPGEESQKRESGRLNWGCCWEASKGLEPASNMQLVTLACVITKQCAGKRDGRDRLPMIEGGREDRGSNGYSALLI